MKLDHIGIAVADPAALQKLFGLMGLSPSGSEAVPEQGVMTHFIPVPAPGAQVELLEPTDPQSTIAQFISKKGPGIHHLSFQLEKGELEPLCDKLQGEGIRLIYSEPQSGAHGMRINFIHPKSAGGVLIELMEKK